eukprot:m.743672 g.743672  ORF g.743672 m.743672 type:complete len:93 (+) comp58947_c0_seq1:188-466(+)
MWTRLVNSGGLCSSSLAASLLLAQSSLLCSGLPESRFIPVLLLVCLTYGFFNAARALIGQSWNEASYQWKLRKEAHSSSSVNDERMPLLNPQ